MGGSRCSPNEGAQAHQRRRSRFPVSIEEDVRQPLEQLRDLVREEVAIALDEGRERIDAGSQHKIEQFGAVIREMGRELQAYRKHLLELGYSDQEALALLLRMEERVFSGAGSEEDWRWG